MKLYIEDDDGKRTELREIDSIPQTCDVLLMFSRLCMISTSDTERIERIMTEKIGKKCVLISGTIDRVVGV